jgi:hypothetical protein
VTKPTCSIHIKYHNTTPIITIQSSNIMSGLLGNDKNKQEGGVADGATGVAKTGTGIVGNTLSGLTNTVGGVVGGAGEYLSSLSPDLFFNVLG